jgi:tetratricopeptide (TPR) repeat protein
VSLTRARRLDEAIAQLNRSLALDANFYVTRYQLGTAYHAKGQFREAIAEYRKALTVNDDPWAKALLTRSLARSGQRDEAIKLIGELQSAAEHRYVPIEGFAIVYFAVGEKDKAFAWLDRAVTERSPRAALFSVNPVFDELRDDARFQDLVRRVALAKID